MCDAFVSGNRSGLWRFGPANDVHAMTDGSFLGVRDRIHAPSMPRARPFGFKVAPRTTVASCVSRGTRVVAPISPLNDVDAQDPAYGIVGRAARLAARRTSRLRRGHRVHPTMGFIAESSTA